MKVAVTGSSGLIGTALVASLRADGHEVIRLVRRPPRAADEARWDPRAADAGLITSGAARSSVLDGLGACVHLAGAGVADHRWTARYKAEVRASRVLGTRALAGALAKLSPPPATLVAASAIGWYGDTGGREVDESAPSGQSFLARLVRDWEAAAEPAAGAGIRVVHPRSGLVLTPRGGLLVPVIRNAGDLNIGGLARKIADLAQRTRDGQVSPDELAGGTFTLTNTGSRGALFDTPIINQPQVGILGTGAVVKRPVVVDDPDVGEVIAVRHMVYLALTYDHRMVDGADAARFLTSVKSRLEEGEFEAELGA